MIHNSKHRNGNFTSSEIVALTTNGTAKGTMGKPAFTYIEECNLERLLGRSIDTESNARPLSWGNLVEARVFELLGIEYQLVSQETIVHPEIDYWSGSPDANKFDEGKTVIDIKAPITLKSFCKAIEPLYNGLSGIQAIKHIRENYIVGSQKTGEKYYWQLVSNAILTGSKFAELIVYCPYRSELEAIQQMAAPSQEAPKSANWIYYAGLDELPWIPDGGYYKNLNVIRFEVPVEDMLFLKNRVLAAGLLLKLIESKQEEALPVGG